MQIGAIVIQCYEFDKMLAFWQEALHYVPRSPANGGWVVLQDPTGKGPNLSLDQYFEPRQGELPGSTWICTRMIRKRK